MIVCKKCHRVRVHECRGMCISCAVLFRYHRRVYGTSIKDFLLMKRYKHYKKIKVRKKSYLKKYTVLCVLRRSRFSSWKRSKVERNKTLIKLVEDKIRQWEYNLKRLKQIGG